MVSLAVTTATISDGASKVFKQLHRIVPSKAGVRHRLAIGHRLIELNVLTAFNKVGSIITPMMWALPSAT